MKSIGVVRKIDDLGRITLPKEDRTILMMEENTSVEIVRVGDEIIIRKYQDCCTVCAEKLDDENYYEIENKLICKKCATKFLKTIQE